MAPTPANRRPGRWVLSEEVPSGQVADRAGPCLFQFLQEVEREVELKVIQGKTPWNSSRVGEAHTPSCNTRPPSALKEGDDSVLTGRQGRNWIQAGWF